MTYIIVKIYEVAKFPIVSRVSREIPKNNSVTFTVNLR